MRQDIALVKLRLVSFVLICIHIVSLMLPWVRIHPPSFFGALSKDNFADVGLLSCMSGSLCDIFNSVDTKDSGLPPGLSGAFNDEAKDNPVYTATVVALCVIGLCFLFIISSEFIWWKFSDTVLWRGIDVRVLCQLTSCTLTILGPLLYVALAHRELHGGFFLSGMWIELFGGISCLVYVIYLMSKLDDVSTDSNLLSKQPSAVTYTKFTYGTTPPL